MVPLVRLPALSAGAPLEARALAVTASSYSSGEHVTFFESAEPVKPWVRSQRKAARDRITHEHLLASSAIPFIFPAKGIEVDDHIEYFGDGSMRQSAPIAPRHPPGAERILDRRRPHARTQTTPPPTPRPTTRRFAQIAGHALSNIFLDALAVDVERVQRINQTLSLIPEENAPTAPCGRLSCWSSPRRSGWMPWPPAMWATCPRPCAPLLGGWASRRTKPTCGRGAGQLPAVWAGYTQELMALGRADTLAMRAQVCRVFFGWTDTGAEVRTQLHQAPSGKTGLRWQPQRAVPKIAGSA